ncbi:RNA polymerase sigma factor [Amycolatopsis saalfeldensis]|uniref:Sigma-70, region 4 n=1 Tax=Amycolatopsis saalfeldensis TaxID=394193 RepID=A0A1H8YKJ9_9PSEU|nr:sigma factor-like helix-turn-helix DNA-binding protein [Amycolatopsis saalfeldensis]SEP52623.1 Sigma-70, region 4 [Amycolatopsis saalfeldensis]
MLATLTPRQRAMVVLRFLEDLPAAEVAGLLGVVEDTVKSQAARGVEALCEPVRTRLACVIGDAVRSRLSSSAKIERLTIPGETPSADPFLPAATGDSTYQLGVRVTDQHGAGAVYVQLLAVVTTNNSGVLRRDPADAVAVQSPLPPLTAEQAADVVLTRGLIP